MAKYTYALQVQYREGEWHNIGGLSDVTLEHLPHFADMQRALTFAYGEERGGSE